MTNPAARAKELFPTIQITLVSIIVALSLEQLLDLLPSVEALWSLSLEATAIWCQVIVAFSIILKMSSGFIFAAVTGERVRVVSISSRHWGCWCSSTHSSRASAASTCCAGGTCWVVDRWSRHGT